MAGTNPSVVFLCSGGGGNMRFLHHAGAHIAACITDRDCGASNYAQHHNIPLHQADFSAAGQRELVARIQDIAPDIIVTNVHRILHAPMLQHFSSQLVNLHYSLLPAYAGTIGNAPVQHAIDAGDAMTGITLHRVTAQLDGGPVLQQIAIPLRKDDALATVMDTVFRAGCLALWDYWKHGEYDGAAQNLLIMNRECRADHWNGNAVPFGDDATIWSHVSEAA